MLKSMLRTVLTLAMAAALGVAHAAWPDRVIRLVLPFPVGSATDAMARFIAEELRHGLGQSVIVENLAGADGIIAAQAVKRAAPDGYTFMVSTNSAHGSNPALYDKLPYDPIRDFEAVGALMRIPQLLVVRSDFPADRVEDFMRVARERAASGRSLNFGTGNTSSRIVGELLKAAMQTDMQAVPYRGTPQALQDLVGGQIDFFVSDPFAAAGLLTGGQIKALAITDSARLPLMPQVPTMAEVGLPTVELVSWAGMFAPANTDAAIIARMNREINRILATERAREVIHRMGAAPAIMNPDEFATFVASEIKRWGRFVDMARIPKK